MSKTDNYWVLTPEQEKIFGWYYVKCDFDDDCDVCENPKGGTYAVGYDEYTGEVDSYICKKCIMQKIDGLVEYHRKEDEEYAKLCTEYLNNEGE